VSAADAVTSAEAKGLFASLEHFPKLLLAVSGGPDSTALLVLAARWRKALRRGPELIAVTIDHGLRPESAREAAMVKRLAGRLGIKHLTRRWRAPRPATGLQRKAREARYRLLAEEAKRAGAGHVLTAHTLDDQAETVLIRLARGSGLTGLAAMTRETLLSGVTVVRPLLTVPKARLIATLKAAQIPFAADPSNLDVTFTRVRMRQLMASLAQEGLTADRLALLARRLKRADAALEAAAAEASARLSRASAAAGPSVAFDAEGFHRLPAEVALRVLGWAITALGDEGPLELGKLEALHQALAEAASANGRVRRTLAGALVTQAGGRLSVETAPKRRARRYKALTTSASGAKGKGKPR
jgi:tRNA(Ile)-lysidine synthase